MKRMLNLLMLVGFLGFCYYSYLQVESRESMGLHKQLESLKTDLALQIAEAESLKTDLEKLKADSEVKESEPVEEADSEVTESESEPEPENIEEKVDNDNN